MKSCEDCAMISFKISEKRKAWLIEYYKTEKYKSKTAAYREKNREKLRKQSRDRYHQKREQIIRESIEYRKKNPRNEKRRLEHNRYRKNHPEKRVIEHKKYYEKYPEKKIAHVKAKKIPLDNECSKCGSSNRLHRHHPDYSKPKEFVTLCEKCHLEVHCIA